MLGSNSQTSTVETFTSISYVEGYLENADYLPTELQYYITHYRELACQIKEISADIMKYNEAVTKSLDASQKKQAILQIQRCLIKQNELGDQKLDILSLMADLIENKVRELETDEHFDIPTQPINTSSSKEEEVIAAESQSRLSADIPSSLNTRSSNIHNNKVEDKQDSNKRKRHGRHRSSTQQEQVCTREDDKKEEEERPKKKKTRRDKANERLQGGVKIIGNIDPNEPVYCSCRQVSYGEMIGCDNDNCHIEWFHFRCVDLTHKPKGKWFCPDCRGDRQNVMKTELVEQQRRAKKNAAVAIAGSCGD